MKKLIYFLLFPVLILTACKDDDDHPACPECEVCEECEEIPGFTNHTVDFFRTHKDFKITLAEYELVTEQVLVKPAHQEGAIFETVTEQYLYKESGVRHRISDSTRIHILVNSEIDSVGAIDCFSFYNEADLLTIEVPAEYKTRTIQVLVQQGAGADVPAEYTTITKLNRTTDAEIVPTDAEQLFNRVVFRIQEDQTIKDYLINQFWQQTALDCLEGNSYFIHD